MKTLLPGRGILTAAAGSLLLTSLLFVNGCRKNIDPHVLKDFNQVNLVANSDKYHPAHIDPALLNAWGLAFSANGIAWVNAEEGHVSAVYNSEGAVARPAVAIPSPGGATGGNPSGVVFNSSSDFMLSNGQPARFIFVGTDGVLSGWNGGAGNTALLVKNNSATSAYTGLTLALNNGARMLYAADFRARNIAVWDAHFNPVAMTFKDPGIPAGFAPFNIQVVGTWLYVTYAKVSAKGDDQPGPGLGFVSIFTTGGSFVKRFASRGPLNAPWGVTAAPASFFADSTDMEDNSGHHGMDDSNGHHGGDIDENVVLVGNFGDGRINVYTESGQFLGQLRSHGRVITIDGLWALSFPPATATTIDPNRLYFTAGPDDEKDGLFGYLIKQ